MKAACQLKVYQVSAAPSPQFKYGKGIHHFRTLQSKESVQVVNVVNRKYVVSASQLPAANQPAK